MERFYGYIDRLNRLQRRRGFQITMSIIGVLLIGGLSLLARQGNAHFLPDAYVGNLISSTIIAALVLIGIVWLGHGVTALAIEIPAVLIWLGLHPLGETAATWGQMALATGSLTVIFFLSLELARLVFSLPWQPLAVSRLVLDEAVRMKLALIFIIALIIFIPLLASQMEVDTPLRYRIQTFLSYGTGFTYAMMAIMTLFVSTATVAFEQRDRQIYQIVSKPMSRFNYLLGKWIGVMGLNVVLLILIGGGVFWFLQYLQTMPALNSYDALATQEQVLTARVGVRPLYQDITEPAWEMTRRELEINHDLYKDDLEGAKKRILTENVKRLNIEQRSIGPGADKEFLFKNLKPISKRKIITATFNEWIDLGAPLKTQFDVKVMREDESAIYALGTHYGLRLGSDSSQIMIAPTEQQREIGLEEVIVEGQRLIIHYYPSNALTLRFKINSGANEPGTIMPLTIAVPKSEFYQVQQVALIQTQTMLIPAGAVEDDGSLVVNIINGDMEKRIPNAESISFSLDGLEVMYKVSGFSSNYFRALLIIWIKLGFLSMLGIATATFASFPVACLLAFSVFLVAEMSPYMTEALEYYETRDPMTHRIYYIKTLISWIATTTNHGLRAFGQVRPTQNLIEGRLVSWVDVGRTALLITVAWTGLSALIGWLAFRARQLAIYSGHA